MPVEVMVTDARGRPRKVTLTDSVAGLTGFRSVKYASGNMVAGVTNAFTFTWQNPESVEIVVISLIVTVATAGGTGTSVLDAGSAADATTHSDNLIDGVDLNVTATTYNNVTDAGTNGKAIQVVAAKDAGTDWITGQILTANASSLVGTYRIIYIPIS